MFESHLFTHTHTHSRLRFYPPSRNLVPRLTHLACHSRALFELRLWDVWKGSSKCWWLANLDLSAGNSHDCAFQFNRRASTAIYCDAAKQRFHLKPLLSLQSPTRSNHILSQQHPEPSLKRGPKTPSFIIVASVVPKQFERENKEEEKIKHQNADVWQIPVSAEQRC